MISSIEVKDTLKKIQKIEWIEMLKHISPQFKNIYCEDNHILHASYKEFKISISISYTTVFLTVNAEMFSKAYLEPKCYELINRLNVSTGSGCHILLNDKCGCMYKFKISIPFFREENIPETIEKHLIKSFKSALKAVELLRKLTDETITQKDLKAYDAIWKKKKI